MAARTLAELRRPHALVGGLAVSARAEPRFTRDVDLAALVEDDRDAEGLIFELRGRGFEVLASIEQEAVGRLATVRLMFSGETAAHGVLLDLLFASSGIEPEVVAAAEPLEVLPGLTLPVARTGHLIAMKLLSESERRLQDRTDLAALLTVAGPADVELARAAVRLVESRGFHRGRDSPSAAPMDHMVRVPAALERGAYCAC